MALAKVPFTKSCGEHCDIAHNTSETFWVLKSFDLKKKIVKQNYMFQGLPDSVNDRLPMLLA